MAIPPVYRSGAFAERMVFGIALYEFLLLGIGLLLGISHHLTTELYTILTCIVAIPLAVQAVRNGIRLNVSPLFRWLRTRRGVAALLLAALMGCVFAIQLGFDAFYGTRQSDGLSYHIPRIIFWIQQHSFKPWITPVWAHIGHPVGADLILGQKIFLGLGWRGIGLVTAILTVGSVACIFIAALDLGLKKWHAVMAAILFSSFPAIGMRIWSVNSDIAAAFPVLAAYVIMNRVSDVKLGLVLFTVLNGVAVACKLTVAPHALLIDSIALWRCRHKISKLRSFALPCAAVALAAAIAFSSYWPVYLAFSDFQAGDGGRTHKVTSIHEFTDAVSMSAVHWILEPLGYLTPIPSLENRAKNVAKTAYNLLGKHFDKLSERLKPWPAQDTGQSGLAAIIFLPILLWGLPCRTRIPASLIFLAGFISLSSLLHFNPFTGRFFVLLYAGFALIWGGTRLFSHGYRRWILTGIVALNVCALLGVVVVRSYIDITVKSQPGGDHYYLSENERKTIAQSLTGRPLHVITGETYDALLVGPNIEYPLDYIICPANGDWEQEFRNASLTSNWLAIVHAGKRSLMTGPADWHRPGSYLCSEESLTVLENALTRSGWRLYKQDSLVDLWRFI